MFAHLAQIGQQLDLGHCSYLTYFEGWSELGALRLRSADACKQGSALWDEGGEALCLVSEDVSDGLYLDYTESEQLNGADEYELWAWGAFRLE